MNKERLVLVRDFLQTHKERFDYRAFCGKLVTPGTKIISNTDCISDVVKELKEDCGTIGCVAGWTVALFPEEAGTIELLNCSYGVMDIAMEVLELSGLAAIDLFSWRNYRREDGGFSLAIEKLDKLIAEC